MIPITYIESYHLYPFLIIQIKSEITSGATMKHELQHGDHSANCFMNGIQNS
jgi:hypothetical protein